MKKVQDHYFEKARKAGYPARSVYKLEEIDQKKGLLKPGMRVLDLGAAPGSWLLYAAERVRKPEGSSRDHTGTVTGVDLQPLNIGLPANARFIQGDAGALAPEDLLAGGGLFDVVLSDMAPKTSGVPSGDALKSAGLVQGVLALCPALLKPGGTLLTKIFQGSGFDPIREEFRRAFRQVSVEKPKAARSESVEVFLLGRGYQPQQSPPEG
ncbi:MAG: RlmE family RNA methyltransferase [Deltaproteobacteria bacterium]|nr:RlmE family RNA methyltransferase [Deltaproteobacteria bacterium]